MRSSGTPTLDEPEHHAVDVLLEDIELMLLQNGMGKGIMLRIRVELSSHYQDSVNCVYKAIDRCIVADVGSVEPKECPRRERWAYPKYHVVLVYWS